MMGTAARRLPDAAAVLRALWYLRAIEHRGARVRLYGRPAIASRGRLVIHHRVILVSTVARLELVAERGGVLEIGARTFVNYGTSIAAHRRVTIGPRSLIGPHCLIMDTPFHHVDPTRRLERPQPEPVTIGENVWLGARVTVLPGVTIGDDAVVGVGSVVTKDIPPATFAAGVPASVIRTL